MELTEKEQALVDTIQQKMDAQTRGLVTGEQFAKEIESLKSAFSDVVTQEKFKTLEDAAIAQGLELKRLATKEADLKYMTIYEQVKSQLKANPEKMEAWKTKQGRFEIELNLKTVGNYTAASVTNVAAIYPTLVDKVIAPVALEQLLFKNNARVFPVSQPQLVYIDEGSPEDAPTVVTEGSGKPKIDTHYTATTILPKKFAAYIKISEEMLADLDFMAAEITNNLITRLEETTDSLLATTGTWGFQAIAHGYTSATLDDKVHDAGIIDVIQAYANQIREAHYTPNLVVVDPAAYSLILLHKDANHRSDAPVSYGADGIARIWGLPIVQSTVLEAGHVCVGDFTKVNLGVYQNVTVEMGWETEDFINNMRTIRAEQRLFFYIKTQHHNAFCYDAWATSAAQIESGGT